MHNIMYNDKFTDFLFSLKNFKVSNVYIFILIIFKLDDSLHIF